MMIWTIAYWMMLVLGGLVGLRAVFWDRAGFRGRAKLRCSKCWYDLSGVSDDLKEEPFQCPECGKKHSSERAMRRTRRSKKQIIVAILILVSASSVRSIPQVQRQGWMVLIPRPVLVLAIPFADGSPGSSFDMTMWGKGGQTTFGDRLNNVIGSRSWKAERSWLADRMVCVFAQLDSSTVITDSTTDRGAIYMSWINSMLMQGAAYGFEERWARSQFYAEFLTNDRIAPGACVFGELKIRRLVQGGYRIDVGMNVAWFKSRTRGSSVLLGGSSFGSGPGLQSAGEYVQLEQWDAFERLPRIAYGESSRAELMVSRYQLDPRAMGEQSRDVPVDVYGQIGDPRFSEQWEKVGSKRVEYEFVADPNAGPKVVEDPKLANILSMYIDAELGFRFDRETSSWEMVASLNESHLQLQDSVTFGGDVTIEVQRRAGQKISYKPLLQGPKKWWRWDPPTQPPEEMGEEEDGYWEMYSDGVIVPGGNGSDQLVSYRLGVPFEDRGHFIEMDNDDGRLVLRVNTNRSDFNRIVYSDLHAEQVLLGELVFKIKNWTVEELNRYRLSGEIPDHAMP